MTAISIMSFAGAALCGLLWAGSALYSKYKTSKSNPDAVKDDGSLYIFVPDAAHAAYLAKMKEAMVRFPAEFQLEQLYSGKSVAAALEAWAKRE